MLYLKAAIWVLEEKSDRAIVHVLPTPQLAWQDVILKVVDERALTLLGSPRKVKGGSEEIKRVNEEIK